MHGSSTGLSWLTIADLLVLTFGLGIHSFERHSWVVTSGGLD